MAVVTISLSRSLTNATVTQSSASTLGYTPPTVRIVLTVNGTSTLTTRRSLPREQTTSAPHVNTGSTVVVQSNPLHPVVDPPDHRCQNKTMFALHRILAISLCHLHRSLSTLLHPPTRILFTLLNHPTTSPTTTLYFGLVPQPTSASASSPFAFLQCSSCITTPASPLSINIFIITSPTTPAPYSHHPRGIKPNTDQRYNVHSRSGSLLEHPDGCIITLDVLTSDES